MRRVVLEPEQRPQRERIVAAVVTVAIEDVDAVLGGHHPEAGIAHCRRELGDLRRRVRERALLVERKQRRGEVLRQRVPTARRVHQAARGIGFAHDRTGMLADLDDEHRRELELGGDPEEERVHADRVRMRQLGHVTDAHHDRRVRPRAPQGVEARQRIGEPEMDRIEDRVGEITPAASREAIDRALERREILLVARDEHRGRVDLVGDPQRALAQAEQIVGAGAAGAQQLLRLQRIGADPEADRPQMRDRLLEMREWRGGQAAEVDHVGAIGGERLCAPLDPGDGKERRVDDLGEDERAVAREIDRLCLAAEELGQVGELFGAADDRNAEAPARRLEVAAAAPGTRIRSAPIASGRRRSIISAVISPATLSPSSCTRQVNGGSTIDSSTRTRPFSASLPVRSRRCSGRAALTAAMPRLAPARGQRCRDRQAAA